MHPDEVAKSFTKLKEAGKVRYFGVAYFKPSQFDLLNNSFPLSKQSNRGFIASARCIGIWYTRPIV